TRRGGAGTAPRALMTLLQRPPLNAQIALVSVWSRPKVLHRLRQALSIARSLVSSLPAKAEFVHSRSLLRTIQHSLREREVDLIVLNGSDLLWLLPELPPLIPRILVAHNIEHELQLSQIHRLNPALRVLRRFLLRDCQRLREYEMSGMRQVKNIIFLSDRDAELVGRECANLNAIVIPPLFDYAPAAWSRTRDQTIGLDIGFMANFSWWPNRDGLRWFLQEVFSSLPDTTRLHLFGEQSRRVVPSHFRIVPHGFVPRLEDIWQMCYFMICPILAGGGVSVKFAEIVYNGMPVAATSFAARGLRLEPHPSIVLLDGAEQWIRFLCSPTARDLALRRGPAPTAKVFAMDSNLATIQAFVSQVAHRREGF